MRKLRLNFAKVFLFIVAVVMPISITGVIGAYTNVYEKNVALAETSTINYYRNYLEDISMTNGNFNSSTVTSISQNPSGWSRQVSDSRTTAGIINVGNNFDNYKNSTYYLSVNPKAKATDSQILMINSKTSANDIKMARNGYQSSSITLSANSFYSFQVSFKSDTNYTEDTTYINRGNVTNDVTIYQSNFNAAEFGSYVSMTYRSTTYYAKKDLSEVVGTFNSEVTSNRAFYYDGTYVGFLYDITPDDEDDTETPIYVNLDDVTEITVPANINMITNPDDSGSTTSFDEDYTAPIADFEEYEDYLRFQRDGITYYVSKSRVDYTVREGAEYYTCSITFNPNTNSYTSGSYTLASGQPYYSQRTDYTSNEEYGQGSIYVTGLVDEDGNEVELSYEKVTSPEWTTFYFFVATGNTEQTVNLELWLGAKDAKNVSTIESTGVVYFDDIKIQRYSENYFYDTYFDYLDSKFYGVSYDNAGTILGEKQSSVKITNLNKNNELKYSEDYNFNFEGVDSAALKGFSKTAGSGNAQIVGLNKDSFELATGNSYAGSNLNVYEQYDEDGNITITPNTQALALWADNNYVEVTAKNSIEIETHGIYKITVDYKLIDVTGTAYLKVQENSSVYADNGLDENSSSYTLSSGSVSGTSNGSSNYNNLYNTLTIYVKGSDLYNSKIDLTLALGSSDESATGCVVFDDIRVERATFAEFEEASSSVELGALSGTPTIENGYFNLTEITDFNYPLTPASWTIEKESGLTFGGIINTKASEYQKYQDKAKENAELEDSENPYLWANYGNPGNPNGNDSANAFSNNILMLANLSSGRQTVTSPTFSLNANSFYKLNFKYLTRSIDLSNITSFKVSIYNDQNVLLFEDKNVSNSAWSDYSVYFQTFEGAENVYVVIDFGTSDNLQVGFAYFDNFELNSSDANEFNSLPTTANKVDMTNYYLNLPTNVITDDLTDFESSAYTGSTNDEGISIGGIVNDSYFENDENFRIEKENDEDVKLFVIRTEGFASGSSTTTHTIESAFNFDLTSGSYYKLTFMLKTKFVYNGTNGDEEFDINDQTYGATVGLTGFDYMTELKSNDEYREYTLYIHPTADATAKLHISLVSDHPLTTGTMVLYNISFEDISTDDDTVPQEFTTAQETVDANDYDVNEDLVAIADATSDDDNSDGDTSDDTTEDTTNQNDYAWLLYVSSIITALAIIVAILGYYLRKIKIKKIETKRKETYDRKGSLHKDVIRQEAEQERAKEVEKLESDIKKFETELENIEKEHKDKVVKLRKDENKVVSKSTEKEFKLFAQKRSVLSEKIDVLKHQLENVKSPEYLLSLERKKFLENEAKQKQLDKESKLLNKQKEDEKKAKESDKKKKK